MSDSFLHRLSKEIIGTMDGTILIDATSVNDDGDDDWEMGVSDRSIPKPSPTSAYMRQLPSIVSRERLNLSPISIHDQLHRLLKRRQELSVEEAADQWDWPTIHEYAAWCDCPPEKLHRFTRGHYRRLDPQIINRLVFLTGLYPHADRRERKRRIVDANTWMRTKEKRKKFPAMMEYLGQRYRTREFLRQARLIVSSAPDRSDPDLPLPATRQRAGRSRANSPQSKK